MLPRSLKRPFQRKLRASSQQGLLLQIRVLVLKFLDKTQAVVCQSLNALEVKTRREK